MLSLRMIIFAGIAGVCLWGLSSLLENLKEPALLRSAQTVVVKGCESLNAHADAARLCPQYLCQKALIDRKQVALESRFEISFDRTAGARRLIGGRIVNGDQHFACESAGLEITNTQLLTAREFAALADASPMQ